MTIYDAIPLICMGAGVLFTLCVFVLLYKEKIYIDRATTEPTEFELPLIGKIKTHTPILGLLVFAMLLVLIPLLTRTPPDKKAELNGNFTYPASLKVYAVVGYEVARRKRQMAVNPLFGTRRIRYSLHRRGMQ